MLIFLPHACHAWSVTHVATASSARDLVGDDFAVGLGLAFAVGALKHLGWLAALVGVTNLAVDLMSPLVGGFLRRWLDYESKGLCCLDDLDNLAEDSWHLVLEFHHSLWKTFRYSGYLGWIADGRS